METKLFIKDSKGNKVSAILSNPSGDKTKPIIILCHGFSSQKNSGSNLAISKNLTDKSFSTFRFDFFAHGESDGNFEDLTVSKAVDDILSAIYYLKNLEYKKIGLEGSSFGGGAALMAASKTKDIYVLAVKCPVSSYLEFKDYTDPKLIAEWKRLGYSYRENKKLNYSFYEDIKKNIVYDVAHDIKVPTLIVHGSVDQEVPVTQSMETAAFIPGCKLEVIEGADHRFSGNGNFEKMVELITSFILKHS